MNLKEKILAFLKQPYPFYYRGKNLVLFVFAIFVLGLAFNYFLEPFEVYVPEHKMDYFWISLLHSLTPVAISIFLFPFLRNPRIDEKWTVGKEVLLIAIFLFLIGFVQFLIRDVIYDNPNNWSWRYFIEEIKNTFLVGTFMLSILISWNHNRLNRQNNKKASELGEIETVDTSKFSSIHIKTQVKGDDFNLNVSDFIFAKAEGNYVEIAIHNNATTNTLLKRISIKDLSEHLQSYTNIHRTHRSYLVNLNCIEKISGNAQGYQLKLKNTEEQVPVSRKMIPLFEERLKTV